MTWDWLQQVAWDRLLEAEVQNILVLLEGWPDVLDYANADARRHCAAIRLFVYTL